MGDHIIDTNVLLVASAIHPDSPFKDSNVPAEKAKIVFEWLMDFRKDACRKIVLDLAFKIFEEYHNKMSMGQDIGSLVVMEKLQTSLVRFVEVAYNGDGHGSIPPELELVVHDLSDRKFVAVALKDISQGEKSTIINAVDSDWCEWEKALQAFGINLNHLIEELCEDDIGESAKGKRRKRSKR